MTIIMNLSFIRFLLTSLSLCVCSDYNIYCTIKHHYKYLQWLETQFMVAEHLPNIYKAMSSIPSTIKRKPKTSI